MLGHPPKGGADKIRTVEVLPVRANTEHTVRFLAGYFGLLTHWMGKHSIPCPGVDKCPESVHRRDQTWKGYAAVERYELASSVWVPYVLEITEALEHSLRGRQLRGEVWFLERPQPGKKKCPVLGQYLERQSLEWLRQPFDINDVLRVVYHNRPYVLGVANPIPPRLCVEVSVDGPPTAIREAMARAAAENNECGLSTYLAKVGARSLREASEIKARESRLNGVGGVK